MNHSRQGSKIDVLVMGLWGSKGLGMDAVEVKVSYSDWCKEWRRTVYDYTNLHGTKVQHHQPARWQLDADTPGTDMYARSHRQCLHNHPDGYTPTVERRYIVDTSKNRVIREHCNRFWIAAPADLARRIKDDVERIEECSGWGVLAVHETMVSALIEAKTVKPTPLLHAKYLGIIRAAADSGANALLRAEQRGFERGYQARKNQERQENHAARRSEESRSSLLRMEVPGVAHDDGSHICHDQADRRGGGGCPGTHGGDRGA